MLVKTEVSEGSERCLEKWDRVSQGRMCLFLSRSIIKHCRIGELTSMTQPGDPKESQKNAQKTRRADRGDAVRQPPRLFDVARARKAPVSTFGCDVDACKVLFPLTHRSAPPPAQHNPTPRI